MKVKFFIIIFLFAKAITQTNAQQITVVGNELIGRIENGESVREVNGNVVLTQGNVIITCDKAIQYILRNDAKLIGNVIVKQDTMTIWTDEGFYFGNERRAFSDKGVKLDDRKVILTARTGEYFFNLDKADFKNNVKLYDTASTLTSNKLIYYKNENKAVAFGNVKIVDKENIIYADSLIHFRVEQTTFGFNNVLINNKTNNSFMFGDHLEDYRLKNFSLIDKNPVLIQIDSSKQFVEDTIKINDSSKIVKRDTVIKYDTLIIKSLVMKAYRDSTNKFIAIDSVEILRGEFASKNEHAIYFRSEEKIVSVKTKPKGKIPVMWYENTQLSGDSIIISLIEKRVNKIDVLNNSLIISQNKNFPKRFDQISGKKVFMFFNNDGLYRVEVFDNVLSIYYMYEETEPNGLIKASSRNATIEFNENKISTVKLFLDPISEYQPENLIRNNERNFLLPTFNYYSDKPQKIKLMNGIKIKFNLN